MLCFPDCDIAPWGDLNAPVYNQTDWLTPGNRTKVYKPLLERQMCGKIIYTSLSYFFYMDSIRQKDVNVECIFYTNISFKYII